MSFTVDSLHHAYGKRSVLRGIFLEVPSGSITGLLGVNGSGKTTLFDCLAGIVQADQAHIILDDRPPGKQLPPLSFAYLPQRPFLPGHFRLSRALRTFLGDGAERVLAEWQASPLPPPAKDPFLKDLSGGERRFMECLAILALDRPALILDEPFALLSPLQAEWLSRRLQEECRHSAILISDHLHQQIRQTAHQIVVLHAGQARPCANTPEALRAAGYLPS